MITMWQCLRLLLTPINSSQMCPFSMYFARFCDNEHVIFKSALVILKDEFEFNQEENNLDATNNRKSSEETHGASNKADLSIKLDLLVPCHLLKGCLVKAIS